MLASSSPHSKLVLPEPNQSEYSQQPESAVEVLHKQYSDYLKSAGDEGKRALSLAYQMMLVQVYGDFRGRKWNMQQGIPGFSGIGYSEDVNPDEVLHVEMRRYSSLAEEVGMSKIKTFLFLKAYPEVYKKYTKMIRSWDAAKKS